MTAAAGKQLTDEGQSECLTWLQSSRLYPLLGCFGLGSAQTDGMCVTWTWYLDSPFFSIQSSSSLD